MSEVFTLKRDYYSFSVELSSETNQWDRGDVKIVMEDYTGRMSCSFVFDKPEEVYELGKALIAASVVDPDNWTDGIPEDVTEHALALSTASELAELRALQETAAKETETVRRQLRDMHKAANEYHYELTRVADDPARALSLRKRGIVR